MKSNHYDLTQGGILHRLLAVALPVMGTQFMQMTYNLTDMFWLGRIGSGAVAASGTVGMYLWLSMAFMIVGRMGSEIGVSQNTGRGDIAAARSFAHVSLLLSAALGVGFAAVMMLLRGPLIGFFNIQEAQVAADARLYLLLVAPGIPLSFITASLSGCFSGSGNTRVPFYINALGLIINMVLDPVLIFPMGLGIAGAAIATVFAQAVVALSLLIAIKRVKSRPFDHFPILRKPDFSLLPQIFRWGFPVGLESMLFTMLSMIISRMVSAYGANALAVQRVCSQIESLSWLISGGYSSALTAFVGQNYGAGKWTRIHRGFKLSIMAMFVYGLAITFLLYFGARPLFMVFLPDPEIVSLGVLNLQILAYCQLAGCVEFTTAGCFRGMGRTLPPSVASITCNAARVVLAYFLARRMGLPGIWWAMSIGACARGVWMLIWYYVVHRTLPQHDEPETQKKAVTC